MNYYLSSLPARRRMLRPHWWGRQTWCRGRGSSAAASESCTSPATGRTFHRCTPTEPWQQRLGSGHLKANKKQGLLFLKCIWKSENTFFWQLAVQDVLLPDESNTPPSLLKPRPAPAFNARRMRWKGLPGTTTTGFSSIIVKVTGRQPCSRLFG